MTSKTYTASDGSTWHYSYYCLPGPFRLADWSFCHDDYDGASDSGDLRYGYCAAESEVPAAIEDLIRELSDDQ